MNTTATRHEAQVDTKIAETYRAYDQARRNRIALIQKLTTCVEGSTRGWGKYESADGKAELLLGLVKYYSKYNGEDVAKKKAEVHAKQITRAEEHLEETAKAYDEAEAQYDGWSRFFLVPEGHIHSSMNCSTCNNGQTMTRFGWLPELSGLNEEDAVKDQGAILCTVCFPSAPVEWTSGNSKSEDDVCPGTGTLDWEGGAPSRMGYYSGNGGTCTHCNEWVSTRSRTNPEMRKHRIKK